MVERRTGTLPTQVRFPGAAREFSPKVNFQCRLFYGVLAPPCAVACVNICAYVKDHVVCVKSSMDYSNTKTPSMYRMLGSATLPQLVFLGESSRNFPWEKPQWDNPVVKEKWSEKTGGLTSRWSFIRGSSVHCLHCELVRKSQ